MDPNERRIYGWSYPPGAENDPNAPYNQVGDDDHCNVCGEELDEDWDEVTCEKCQDKAGREDDYEPECECIPCDKCGGVESDGCENHNAVDCGK